MEISQIEHKNMYVHILKQNDKFMHNPVICIFLFLKNLKLDEKIKYKRKF